MKSDKKIDPQSTNRNEDRNQVNPTNTGNSHLNQGTQNPQTPQTPQKEEKETWKHPDPTAPEKRQEVYAGDKKDRTTGKQQDQDYENEGLTDEDVDTNPRAEAKNTVNRGKERDDVDGGRNQNDQINP